MQKSRNIFIIYILTIVILGTFVGYLMGYERSRIIRESAKASSKLNAEIDKLKSKIGELETELAEYYDPGFVQSSQYSFQWPMHKDDYIDMTSPFGLRNVPGGIFTGGSPTREHEGLDLYGTWQARIVAADAGIVKEKWYVPNAKLGREGHPIYGGYIVIEHLDGSETSYAHCSEIYVREGDHVVPGQVIARQGDTGLADGAHLHFTIKINGEAVNPLKYVQPIDIGGAVKIDLDGM